MPVSSKGRAFNEKEGRFKRYLILVFPDRSRTLCWVLYVWHQVGTTTIHCLSVEASWQTWLTCQLRGSLIGVTKGHERAIYTTNTTKASRTKVHANSWFPQAEGGLEEELLGLGRYGKTLMVLTVTL